jgi:hypothetical protein
MRGGVLYVLQGAPHYGLSGLPSDSARYSTLDGASLTLSAIDVSQLPAVTLLGQVSVTEPTTSYLNGVKPLWVNDRTLIFSAQNTFYWGGPYYPTYVTSTATNLSTGTLSTASVSSTASASISLTYIGLPYFRSWNWNNSTDLFAFDVTTPSQPKFASHLTFGQAEAWNVTAPLAAHDTVYLGYKVLPSPKLKPEPQGTGSTDPVNRYFLKLIDYSDSTKPIVAEGGVNIPGELRALGEQGTILYTVGPRLNLTDGALAGSGCAVQASAFDGAAAPSARPASARLRRPTVPRLGRRPARPASAAGEDLATGSGHRLLQLPAQRRPHLARRLVAG